MLAHARRSSRTAVAVAAGLVVGAVSVAYAAIPDTATGQFNGCANKATGVLRVIDVAKGQKCISTGALAETAITWNQKGQPGPQGIPGPRGVPGPAGTPGRLECADEQRIHTVLPTFAIRPECTIVAATNLGPAGEFNLNAVTVVETLPFGNPPADHDVAQRFRLSTNTPLHLVAVEVPLLIPVGPGPLTVRLMGATPPTDNQLSSVPDESNVLQTWSVPHNTIVDGGLNRFTVTSSVTLDQNEAYWLVLSYDQRPGNSVRWFASGGGNLTGSAFAERYFNCPTCPGAPDSPWIGTDHPQGRGIRVTGY